MRISKTLDGSVRFSLLYSFLLRCWIDFACLDLIRQNTWHTHAHTHTCTPRSRAIADAWSLNNLLLFDRTLFAKLNGQTICSSSVKVPTSDYPSTDAHLFRLVFFFRCKVESLSCERYRRKEERRREKNSKRWLLKMGMDE